MVHQIRRYVLPLAANSNVQRVVLLALALATVLQGIPGGGGGGVG